jgi:hypothetical protein
MDIGGDNLKIISGEEFEQCIEFMLESEEKEGNNNK